jgi:DNA-binding LacI/PurR family transcriptional regulator
LHERVSKTPTVYDVAERAGVSIATVSFAFRKPERVKDSTREAVLEAARELGYVPNASARGLAQRRTGALGLYSYDFLLREPLSDEPRTFPLYVDEVQRGMQLACWEQGLALMTGGGVPSDGGVVTDIAGRVDGLAVFPQTVPLEELQVIARRIPVVEVSEPAVDDGLDHVTVDNVGGLQQLTQHLVEVHGLTDLVFVGNPASHEVMARFKGFRAAQRKAGLSLQRKPMHVDGTADDQAADLLDQWDAPPQAVVCSTDQEALAFLDAFRARGKRVPQDVVVTGFDGILAGRLSTPTLTTVRQPMAEMGRAVVDILVSRLLEPTAEPECRQLAVELVLRESCGCASSRS